MKECSLCGGFIWHKRDGVETGWTLKSGDTTLKETTTLTCIPCYQHFYHKCQCSQCLEFFALKEITNETGYQPHQNGKNWCQGCIRKTQHY